MYGFDDRQHLLDAGVALERQRREQLALADRPDHRRVATVADVRARAGLLEACDHLVHLVGGRLSAHHDQELGGSDDGHAGQSRCA